MKVVVTGGAGFIGANLCRALSAEPATSLAEGLSRTVEWFRGSPS